MAAAAPSPSTFHLDPAARLMLEAARAPLVLIDPAGEIRALNDVAAGLLGASSADLAGRPWEGPDGYARAAADAASFSVESTTVTIGEAAWRLFTLHPALPEVAELQQRLEVRERETRALLEASRNLTANLALEPLVGSLLEHLNDVIDYSGASLLVFEGPGRLRVLEARRRDGEATIRSDTASGLVIVVNPDDPVWRTLYAGEGIVVGDVQDETPTARSLRRDMRAIPRERGSHIRAWMATPLVVSGTAAGLLTIARSEPNSFTPGDVELARAFAVQASAALANAGLFEQLRQQAVQNETLAQVAAHFTLAGDVGETLSHVSSHIVRATGAVAADIVVPADMPDSRQPGMTRWAFGGHGHPPGYLETCERLVSRGAVSPIVTVMRRMELLRFPNARATIAAQPGWEELRPFIEAAEWDLLVVVPLVYRGRAIGVIDAYFKPEAEPAEETLAFLRAIADQAAVGVENVRLFDHTQRSAREYATLAGIAVDLTVDRPMDEALRSLCESVVRGAGALAATISLLDDDGKELRIEGGFGISRDYLASARRFSTAGMPGRRRLLEEGRPIVVTDLLTVARRTPEFATILPHLAAIGANSGVFLPLFARGRALGALSLFFAAAGAPTADELRFLGAVANQVTVALDNKQLYERMERSARESAALAAIAANITLGQPVRSTLDTVATSVVLATNALTCTVSIVDPATGAMMMAGGAGVPDGFVEIARRVADDPSSWRNRAIQQGTPLIQHGAREAILANPAFESLWDAVRAAPWNTVVTLPVSYGGRYVGALQVGYEGETEPSSDEWRLLAAIADQLAVAIENAGLYLRSERSARENAALAEIARNVVVDQPMRDTLNAISENVVRATSASGAAVFLVDQARDRITLTGGFGIPEVLLRKIEAGLPASAGFTVEAFRDSSQIFVPDARTKMLANPVFSVVHAELERELWDHIQVVPIVYRGTAVGALYLTYAGSLGPTAEERQLLDAIANQAAVAIENINLFQATESAAVENARLYEEGQRRVAELEVLTSIAESLTVLQPFEVTLQTLVAEVVRSTEAVACSVLIASGEAGPPQVATAGLAPEFVEGIRQVYSRPPRQDRLRRFLDGEIETALFTSRSELLAARDLAPLHEGAAYASWERFIIVGLRYQGRPLGTLAAYYPEGFEPGEQEANLLRAIADQVAVALENARLYEEGQRRVRELEALQRIAASLTVVQPMEKTFDTLVRSVVDSTPAIACAVSLIDDDGRVTFMTAHGLPEGYVEAIAEVYEYDAARQRAIRFNQDPRAILSTRQALLASPVFGPAHEALARASYDAYITVALRYRDRGIGSLNAYFEPGYTPDERDINLLRAIADQAAVAVENARLFAEAERRAREQQVLATIASAITNDRPINDVLDLLAGNIVNHAGVAGATVLLFGEDRGNVNYGSFGMPDGYVAAILESRRIHPEVWEHLDRATETSVLEHAREFIATNATYLPLRDFAPTFPWDCIVRVPLVYQQEARGILMLYLDRSTAPPPEDIAFYEAIAERVTFAVENARLFADSERRAAEQAALAVLGSALAYDRPLPEVLETLARSVSEQAGARAAAVLVFGEGRVPIAAGSWGLPPGYVEETLAARAAHPEVWTDLDRATEIGVLENARAFLRENATHPPMRRFADLVEWDCVVRVPFLYRDRTRGMLNLYLDGSLAPGRERLQFFRALADRASFAVESARLFADIERRAREQAALANISSALTYDRPLGEALDVLAEAIVAETEAVGVAVVVYQGVARPVASGVAGLPDGYLSAIAEARRADPAFWEEMESMTEPSVLDHAQERIRRDREWATLQRFLPLRWDCVVRIPFSFRERTHGMLNLFLPTSETPSQRDMEFYLAVADRVSVVVDNANLFAEVQSRTQELTALYRADEELHRSLNLDEVLTSLMELVVEMLHADGSAFIIWEPESPEPRVLTAGPSTPEATRRVVESLVAEGREQFVRIARERHEQPLAITETRDNPQAAQDRTAELGIRSIIDVGVIVGDEVFGRLTAYNMQRRRFSDDERRLFQSLSRRAAVAIENARLFGQAEERARHIGALYRADQELHRSLDLEEVMTALLSTVIDTFEADSGSVILWQDDQPRPRLITIEELPQSLRDQIIESFVRQGRESYIRMLAAAEAHAVEDTSTRSPLEQERSAAIGVQSLIEAPLRMDGRFVGHVVAVYRSPRRFAPDEPRLLASLARRAEVAIENARLFGEVRDRTQQLEALYRADEELHRSLELDEVLRGLISTVRDTFDADGVAAVVWEPGDARPRFLPSDDASAEMVERVVDSLVAMGRDAYIAARTGVRMLEETAAAPPDVRARTYDVGVRALLEAPLRAEGETIGHIGVAYAQPRRFSLEEQRLLASLAKRAEVAIDNARLYGRAQTLAAVEERQRLARELHDSVSQALYGIALGARTARTLLDRDPLTATEPVDYVLSLAEAGLAEMRALIFELRPESLEQEGLVAAIDKQVASTRARYGVAVEASLCPEPELALPVKEALYRVAQEALHNVVKHARATRVDLALALDDGRITLDLRDDGVGFDPTGEFPGHLGLRSMRERVARVGGSFLVESAPGAGTRLRAEIPVRR